jgi:uroporphyrinogen decarboxylase
MTDPQWEELLGILDGELLDPLPVGFLVDGPWFAALGRMSLMEYLTDNRRWLEVNLEASRRFPDVFWLPGFWAEFGMISNPPSFGAKCIWPEDGFPTCDTVLRGYEEIADLQVPNVRTDGLLPLIMQRLRQNRAAIEDAGHRIRFASSHGPFTIASYVVGHSEFLIGMRTMPEAIHDLLRRVTQYIIDWLQYQRETFSTIEGVLILDDLIGFVGEADFREFAMPYMCRSFHALDVPVRFLHNDAHGLVTARFLDEMGVNLFNFSFEHPVAQIRALAGDRVTLLGNIPPRDVLSLGTCEDIRVAVEGVLRDVRDPHRFIVSGGGFTPAQFTEDKVRTFCAAVSKLSKT